MGPHIGEVFFKRIDTPIGGGGGVRADYNKRSGNLFPDDCSGVNNIIIEPEKSLEIVFNLGFYLTVILFFLFTELGRIENIINNCEYCLPGFTVQKIAYSIKKILPHLCVLRTVFPLPRHDIFPVFLDIGIEIQGLILTRIIA